MVALRNVNLESHPRRISDTMGIRCHFLATEDGEDSSAEPLQCMYLVESSAEASTECSRRLATLTKNKTKTPGKRSVHLRNQESKKRTRKSSTVESTYWRFFTSQVFRLTIHVTIVLYCSLDSY